MQGFALFLLFLMMYYDKGKGIKGQHKNSTQKFGSRLPLPRVRVKVKVRFRVGVRVKVRVGV